MIDWGLVANIAGGGYGLTILVLVILFLIAWLVGLVIQKTGKTSATKDAPPKDK
jgi:Na+-transporting methylmalonyl-CoA/oxaloacetate decarboxylase gamma subunit